jgi:hypothetical protein
MASSSSGAASILTFGATPKPEKQVIESVETPAIQSIEQGLREKDPLTELATQMERMQLKNSTNDKDHQRHYTKDDREHPDKGVASDLQGTPTLDPNYHVKTPVPNSPIASATTSRTSRKRENLQNLIETQRKRLEKLEADLESIDSKSSRTTRTSQRRSRRPDDDETMTIDYGQMAGRQQDDPRRPDLRQPHSYDRSSEPVGQVQPSISEVQPLTTTGTDRKPDVERRTHTTGTLAQQQRSGSFDRASEDQQPSPLGTWPFNGFTTIYNDQPRQRRQPSDWIE